MKGGVDNVIRIPTSLNGKFFNQWFKFILPLHNLTNREIDVAAAFVKHRYRLSKLIMDENLIDQVLMSDETKKAVREDCGISKEHFQVVMSNLRKAKVIIDGKLNLKLTPNIKEENGNFKLLILFDFNE